MHQASVQQRGLGRTHAIQREPRPAVVCVHRYTSSVNCTSIVSTRQHGQAACYRAPDRTLQKAAQESKQWLTASSSAAARGAGRRPSRSTSTEKAAAAGTAAVAWQRTGAARPPQPCLPAGGQPAALHVHLRRSVPHRTSPSSTWQQQPAAGSLQGPAPSQPSPQTMQGRLPSNSSGSSSGRSHRRSRQLQHRQQLQVPSSRRQLLGWRASGRRRLDAVCMSPVHPAACLALFRCML